MASLLPSGVLFVGPYTQPLAAAPVATSLPLAVRKFFLTDGVTAATVYQDVNLATPFTPTNQVTATSAGRFPPIYLDPTIVYRAQLFTAGGVLLEDANPYFTTPFGLTVRTKPADTSRASTAVPVTDPDLVIALSGAGTWEVEGILAFTAPTAVTGTNPGVSWSLAYSGAIAALTASSFALFGEFDTNGFTSFSSPFNTTLAYGLGGVGVVPVNSAYVHGVLTGGAAGVSANLSVNWSQQTSNAASITLQKGSYLLVRQLA